MRPQSDPTVLSQPTPDDPSIDLLQMPLRQEGYVVGMTAGDGVHADLAGRLGELGFLPGEPIQVIAKASFGGPLAVRVAGGTFALRQVEAATVRVVLGRQAPSTAGLV